MHLPFRAIIDCDMCDGLSSLSLFIDLHRLYDITTGSYINGVSGSTGFGVVSFITIAFGRLVLPS
jgi:hypothetical protein